MYELLIVLSRPLVSVLSCFEVDLDDIIVGHDFFHAIQQQQQKQHILYVCSFAFFFFLASITVQCVDDFVHISKALEASSIQSSRAVIC